MSEKYWQKSRQISKRVVVEGVLELLTPASFGNGDADGVTDMSLLRDPLEGRALLTGATIAGALRNYLWEREIGYHIKPADLLRQDQKRLNNSLAVKLFGGIQQDADGNQSLLIVDDALGAQPQTEFRDGVSIDAKTRTAADNQKFDFELLRAGTTFPLRFELLIVESQDEQTLRNGLAVALSGFEQGNEICLGVRKRRGFGVCKVSSWQVTEYDLTNPHGLVDWLEKSGEIRNNESIAKLLCADEDDAKLDNRHEFHMKATFAIEGSLLIRSGVGALTSGPDAMHIHRLEVQRGGNGDGDKVDNKPEQRPPVLPGTSLAGAVRHRALRIAQTLYPEQGNVIVDRLFGSVFMEGGKRTKTQREKYTGSRIVVRETEIDPADVRTMIQNRIRIDRFTGGVLDNYLFDEAPLFGGPESRVLIDLTVRNPLDHEIGLLLHVLKDLWTSDLPVGGAANIGRGRLAGRSANLTLKRPNMDGEMSWVIQQQPDGELKLSTTTGMTAEEELESFAEALHEWEPNHG